MDIINNKPTRFNLRDKNYYKKLSVNEDNDFDITIYGRYAANSKDSSGWSIYLANIVISGTLDDNIIHYYRN
jgi:hypothetical protein